MPRRQRGDDPVKITAYLPRELHRTLKVTAATQGVTMSNIIESMIRKYVKG